MQPLPVFAGSRLLVEGFGLPGVKLEDPRQFNRTWTIHRLFAPVPGRSLGGIRAQVFDEKGFTSFINQQDLELLLELARPGDWCPWTGKTYPGLNSPEEGWYGVCCDQEDLQDDLYIQELFLRGQHSILPTGLEITRRIHYDADLEEEELLVLLWDKAPENNYSPDPRMCTLQHRWTTVERTKIEWSKC
jgi:hypothetical protein